MGIHNGKYYLSNSEMIDWEEMCPRIWKAIHFDKVIEKETTEAMEYGSLFETMVIGSGVQGKITKPTEKMMKSVYYERCKAQAEDCKRYLELLGGEIISRQEYIYTEFIDDQGQEIPVCGGLDILYGWPKEPDRKNLIIDTKFTGNTDSDFGKYAWGNPDKVDPQQAVQYTMLHKLKYGLDADFQWWVYDRGTAMGQKHIEVEVTELAIAIHQEKCARICNEIMLAIEFDDWGYKNTFENCRDCPAPCSYRRIMPETIKVIA